MADAEKVVTKRGAIDKATTQTIAIVGVTAFVSIFCLMAAKAEVSQNLYLGRVLKAKHTADKQLEDNLKAFDQLSKAYETFDGSPTNVIGGSANGSGDNDGKNSKIILDALPDTYDFPRLASSIEKVLTDQGLKVASIGGVDDQLAQQANTNSPAPQATAMPFSFTVSDANYASVSKLVSALQRSIRPLQIDSLSISGGGNNMTMTANAHSYYQPGKTVNVTSKEIK